MFTSPTDVPVGPPGRMLLPRSTRFSGIVSFRSISHGANAPADAGAGSAPAGVGSCGVAPPAVGAAGGIAPLPARDRACRVASSAPVLDAAAVEGSATSGIAVTAYG